MSGKSQAGVDVLVCRGCCCGTDKHPGADHAAQLAHLREAVADTPDARLLVADCLGACENSNVVLLHRRGATSGRRRLWFGQVLEGEDTAAMCAWIRQGGPSAEDRAARAIPARLDRLRIGEPREADTSRVRADKPGLG
jgi:hypothetical protein